MTLTGCNYIMFATELPPLMAYSYVYKCYVYKLPFPTCNIVMNIFMCYDIFYLVCFIATKQTYKTV